MALTIRTTGVQDFLDGSANIKVMIVGGPDMGKGFPRGTPILTPAGWRMIGELAVGEQVIGSTGEATTVTDIVDRGEQPLYRLDFSDGATIVCDGDHLWPFRTYEQWEESASAPPVVRTADLLGQEILHARSGRKSTGRYYLPIVGPVQHDKVDLPVDPYLLGVLLANGSMSDGVASFIVNDEHVAGRVIERNTHLDIAEHVMGRFIVHASALSDLGLDRLATADRFIPAKYLVAHEEARRELLAGLMDCDGGTRSGAPTYYTRSSLLAADIAELVRSLGGIATIVTYGGDHVLTVRMPTVPFTLPRKAERVVPRRPFRYLTAITTQGYGQSRCIKVDADDELFVVQHHLVTHNTRFASYWPRPFYLDCENSRGSLRDRGMPYVEINTSADMLDALEYLRSLERTSKSERRYQTVVVDTLDSFQRKIKDEWIQDKNVGVFSGFDAWGYLDAKMQMLLARLLNLDYHVIVNVHWVRERVRDEDEGPRQYALQLDGKIQNQVFNDFALVGRIGTYWVHDTASGQKVERRGLTFNKSSEWPFLKDRFALFGGRWLPVVFDDEDWNQISRAFAESAENTPMPEAEQLDEIPTTDAVFARTAVAPMPGGPVPARPARQRDLADLTKVELLAKAREAGIDVKANWVKAELVNALAAHQAAAKAEPEPTPEPTEPTSEPEPASLESDEHEKAVAFVVDKLGATVVEEKPNGQTAAVPELPAESTAPVIGGRPVKTCDECGKSLSEQKYSYVQLAWFKFRRLLCFECYQDAIAKTATR